MPRTMSSDSVTLHSVTYDPMDPEVRAQILSNAQVIYNENSTQYINIATCRGPDGSYLAFIVARGGLVSALSNPNALSSEPRQSRSAALMSLLEATEECIKNLVWKNTGKEMPQVKRTSHQAPLAPPKELPETTIPIIDYSEKPPKEKSFWRKHASHSSKMESAYATHI
ncbi:MAG: hypothetical protein Q9227_001261 [Pyrenula ochraceoflavens]